MKVVRVLVILLLCWIVLNLIFFPRVYIGIDSGGKAKAKNAVFQLTTAAKAYKTEYGVPPEGDNKSVLAVLEGENPRKIVFLEIDPKEISKDGIYLDPWGTPYVFDLSTQSAPWAYSFGKNKRDEKGKGDDCTSWE